MFVLKDKLTLRGFALVGAHTPRCKYTRTLYFPHLNNQGLHYRHAHPEYAELHSHARTCLKGSSIPSPFKYIEKALTSISESNYITENT